MWRKPYLLTYSCQSTLTWLIIIVYEKSGYELSLNRIFLQMSLFQQKKKKNQGIFWTSWKTMPNMLQFKAWSISLSLTKHFSERLTGFSLFSSCSHWESTGQWYSTVTGVGNRCWQPSPQRHYQSIRLNFRQSHFVVQVAAISSTFYVQLFHTKVFCAAFISLLTV